MDLLAQMAQIPSMELGRLCAYTFKDRPTQSGPYLKLQAWEQGKNVTRFIRPEQVPLVEAVLAGYAQFKALVGQYAQQVIDQTGTQLATGPCPTSCWPKTWKSGS